MRYLPVVAIGSLVLLAGCATTVTTTQAIPATTRPELAVQAVTASLAPNVDAPSDTTALLQAAVLKSAEAHHGGTMPIDLKLVVTQYDVASGGARLFGGIFMGSNKLTVNVEVDDAHDGNVIGRYDVTREANPGGAGAFYDQAKATIDAAAAGVIQGLYGTTAN